MEGMFDSFAVLENISSPMTTFFGLKYLNNNLHLKFHVDLLSKYKLYNDNNLTEVFIIFKMN